jgi:hypothetical protein
MAASSSSSRAGSGAGPSAPRMNPLVQPVPSFARTTRSMTSHNLAGQTSRASHAAASAASRPAARRPEAGKLNGRWDPGPAVASTSRAAAGSRPAASSIKGKERATTSASHHASPNGSGRPRKSARRSKEDGDTVARFLPGPAAALPPPVGPKAPAGRRPPRARSFGSSSLTSLASTTAPNNENVPFLAEPEDEGSDDDLNIQPSPRKKQPPPLRLGSTPPPSPTGSRAADPPLSPSRRANPGVKRSRARAFDEGHLSPPKVLRLAPGDRSSTCNHAAAVAAATASCRRRDGRLPAKQQLWPAAFVARDPPPALAAAGAWRVQKAAAGRLAGRDAA